MEATFTTTNGVLFATRSDLKLDGSAATVNEHLALRLREVVWSFEDAAVPHGFARAPSYATKLQELQNTAAGLWDAAHVANLAVYDSTRLSLQSSVVEPVTEYMTHKIDTCSNTHHDHAFTLSEMLPQYFGANAKVNLHSVRIRFEGSGGGEGSFDLSPGVGEHLVSTGGIEGERYNGNRVYYNPQTTGLRVTMEGAGWGRGVCDNRLQMSHIELNVTRNALALQENAVYSLPYIKAAAPAFN
jgi:hypothetical protein